MIKQSIAYENMKVQC